MYVLFGCLKNNFNRERRCLLQLVAIHSSVSPHPNSPQCFVNFKAPPDKRVYEGTGIICTDMVLQTKPEDLAPTTYSVHSMNMLELNSQLKHLVKRGQLCEAKNTFDKMPHRDEVSWTTMIAGYVNAKNSNEALSLFSNMLVQPGLKMDPFMISIALKACAISMNMYNGELLHAFSVKSGLINSVFVGSAILDLYMKIGKLEQGCQVFEEMTERNIVSWTAIIVGLVHAGYSKEGLLYFSRMWSSKVGCDSYAFAIALKASADSGSLLHGKAIHTQAMKNGFDESSFVANSLVTMYNKCGKPDYGLQLFERMRMPDVVSWTTIITTYSQMGEDEHAVEAFKKMRKSDVSPNEYTFSAVISACANLAIAEWGQQLHAHVFRLGLEDALSVANSIMTLYSKVGQLTLASMVFHDLTRKDIVSWSTIIAGYSQGGYGKEAFDYVSWMRREGQQPNEFALASLLSVCGSMALLEQGKQVHAHSLCIGFDHEAMVQKELYETGIREVVSDALHSHLLCIVLDSGLYFKEIYEVGISPLKSMKCTSMRLGRLLDSFLFPSRMLVHTPILISWFPQGVMWAMTSLGVYNHLKRLEIGS
ncbi:hypothetical protein L6164_006394 [Bauhinia variegata]|uniref:Uncharacterized protein n=1 Tax=Bauhinia variegata TaxID=167791 RepID=A0ACB9PWE2_BAUVA|nr:hypothetical protein L6164_006394 [Bauhinia variegata]